MQQLNNAYLLMSAQWMSNRVGMWNL